MHCSVYTARSLVLVCEEPNLFRDDKTSYAISARSHSCIDKHTRTDVHSPRTSAVSSIYTSLFFSASLLRLFRSLSFQLIATTWYDAACIAYTHTIVTWSQWVWGGEERRVRELQSKHTHTHIRNGSEDTNCVANKPKVEWIWKINKNKKWKKKQQPKKQWLFCVYSFKVFVCLHS